MVCSRVFSHVFSRVFSHVFYQVFYLGQVFSRVLSRVFYQVFSRVFYQGFYQVFSRVFYRVFSRVFFHVFYHVFYKLKLRGRDIVHHHFNVTVTTFLNRRDAFAVKDKDAHSRSTRSARTRTRSRRLRGLRARARAHARARGRGSWFIIISRQPSPRKPWQVGGRPMASLEKKNISQGIVEQPLPPIYAIRTKPPFVGKDTLFPRRLTFELRYLEVEFGSDFLQACS